MGIDFIIGSQKERGEIIFSANINVLLISAAKLAAITIVLSIIPKASNINLHIDS